jgi:hypothetical protein
MIVRWGALGKDQRVGEPARVPGSGGPRQRPGRRRFLKRVNEARAPLQAR